MYGTFEDFLRLVAGPRPIPRAILESIRDPETIHVETADFVVVKTPPSLLRSEATMNITREDD